MKTEQVPKFIYWCCVFCRKLRDTRTDANGCKQCFWEGTVDLEWRVVEPMKSKRPG